MTDAAFIPVVLALVVPWAAGALLVARLTAGTGAGNHYIALGHGFFAGLFLVTLLMRAADLLGPGVNFAALLLVMLLVAAMLGWRRGWRTLPHTPVADAPLPAWASWVVGLLLLLIAARYATILVNVVTSPLYAWDAWMNWAPKAVVWQYFGERLAFVAPPDWLAAAQPEVFSLGNFAASTYPETVPLLYWWMMLAAGSADSSLVLLPWVLAPLALCCALYGHLRSDGVSVLPAVVAVYALANLPYIGVHSALAGYADLWLMAAFSLALLALVAVERTRDPRWVLLVIFWCLLCVTLKRPGLVLAAIALLALWRSLLPLPRALELALLVSACLLAALILLLGLQVDVPGLGTLRIDRDGFRIPGLGTQAFHHPQNPGSLLHTLFVAINWNLLFYLAPPVLLAVVWRRRWQNLLDQRNLALALALTLAAIAGLYGFTYMGEAQNFSTSFNRHLIYVIPAGIYLLCLCFVRTASTEVVHS